MNGLGLDMLLHPARLYSRREVLVRACPVPRAAGVYAWYFKAIPRDVPTEGCHKLPDATLLYVGISPNKPPTNGKPPSRQRLANRIRYHFRGNASGSTLRLTLGCLLSRDLGIELRRVGSGTRLTFTPAGEATLSAWMEQNAFVAWMPIAEPWALERELIASYSLPLNLDHNGSHPFHASLSALRAQCKASARARPVALSNRGHR